MYLQIYLIEKSFFCYKIMIPESQWWSIEKNPDKFKRKSSKLYEYIFGKKLYACRIVNYDFAFIFWVLKSFSKQNKAFNGWETQNFYFWHDSRNSSYLQLLGSSKEIPRITLKSKCQIYYVPKIDLITWPKKLA